ncbi:MAG: 5,6-dimethylbenzimidazole synthase [Rhodospirillaceae bacterium]|nr:5,6-dimethylbenzimidazole synthase [Rhodospirillaceae bacterium]MBT6886219.1 5,6-dimethylbenzimidazole synthase [Rhodospirillaceae bacterium]
MNAPLDKSPAPDFDAAFLAGLEDLLRWRRDVRRFLSDAVPSDLLDELLTLAALAPSVGNSQPWRFVKVNAPERRAAIRENFEACNADALADYEGERAKLYATLKLNGFDQAPVQLAVFLDTGGELGHGAGTKTMPETLAYSVVGAIQTFWLAARSRGIGVGWVSILDADKVRESLDVSEDWQLIGYLCVGYPQEEHIDPELDRHGWQERVDAGRFIVER